MQLAFLVVEALVSLSLSLLLETASFKRIYSPEPRPFLPLPNPPFHSFLLSKPKITFGNMLR